jgi:hypothetical protein
MILPCMVFRFPEDGDLSLRFSQTYLPLIRDVVSQKDIDVLYEMLTTWRDIVVKHHEGGYEEYQLRTTFNGHIFNVVLQCQSSTD